MSEIREARVKGVDFKRDDERGSFVEVINAGPWESLAYGRMRAGAVMGRHYHEKTRIYFFVQSGSVEIETRDVATGAEGRFEVAGGQAPDTTALVAAGREAGTIGDAGDADRQALGAVGIGQR